MAERVLGLHHITAIARSAQRNFDFYTKVLGLRLVKKTVNFDDPGTYHFYYGNEIGSAGTILTFFPWEGITAGLVGTGMATEIGYSVPQGSLDFWKKRLDDHHVKREEPIERMGEESLLFADPDGLKLSLIVSKNNDSRKPWETNEVKQEVATKGFHSITLTLKNIKKTADILEKVFGYGLAGQSGERNRFQTDAIDSANIVDLVEAPNERLGHVAGGTNHHVAFRVPDETTLMHFREKVLSHGLNITPKIDRNYFFSLYFREPGGVLFELATENPGFAVDEPVAELGTHLKLPVQHEPMRQELEKILPVLKT